MAGAQSIAWRGSRQPEELSLFTLRFDMRCPPEGPAGSEELYAAALEMAAWGETHGCLQAIVSEHHASPDGYLPAPLILAAALAGRTRTLRIQVAALLVPLHDPVELAEQMAVLDIASQGRVSYVVALGYREAEYALLGRRFARRGERMETCLEVLRRAWNGEAFEFEGRPVRVTPPPLTAGGPALLMGGSSNAAVRRAARLGLGMITQGGDHALEEIYRAACERAGTRPGMFVNPPVGTVTSAFIARDPDTAWERLGRYLLRDARSYADWLEGSHAASKSKASSIQQLRAEQGAYRIFTPAEAIDHAKGHGLLLLQPLCGGMPPELAWESLELLAAEVLPALAGS